MGFLYFIGIHTLCTFPSFHQLTMSAPHHTTAHAKAHAIAHKLVHGKKKAPPPPCGKGGHGFHVTGTIGKLTGPGDDATAHAIDFTNKVNVFACAQFKK